MSRLNNTCSDALGVYDTLMKRLTKVSRIEPVAGEKAGGPDPSTNCQLADEIGSAVAMIESLTRQMRGQIGILEI